MFKMADGKCFLYDTLYFSHFLSTTRDLACTGGRTSKKLMKCTRYIAIYFLWHSWWRRLLMTMTQLFEKPQQQKLVLFIMVASRKSNFFRPYSSVFNEMETMLVYQANPVAVRVELFLCQRFLLFHYICIDAGYVRSIPWSKSSAKVSFKVE